ncbi:MAG: FAD:protein FMN transferase [Thermoguttaceae bacterium]|nr:FAD:protein FMN transferase [Thermoguttaceae bacterium]
MRIFLWAILSWMLTGGTVSASDSMQRYRFTHTSMSIDLTILAYASEQTVASEAAAAAFARIDQLDGILSDYNPESELRRLCDTAGSGALVPVSDDLWYVLRRSVEFAEWTDGAFDITAAPVIRLWRRSRTSRALPSPERMSEALKLVNWRNIEFDPATQAVRLKVSGMRLDVGGIAKGYIVAEALKTLRLHGVQSALLSAGGDVGVSDPPPGQDGERGGWVLGVAPLTTTQGINRVQPAYREISDLSAEDIAQQEHSSRATDVEETAETAHASDSVGATETAEVSHSSDTPDSADERDIAMTAEQRPSHYVVVSNCFAATSGDAFQFVVINGVRYSHILDPRTGQAVTTPYSVSLVGQDAVAADALATTMNVLGPEAGVKLLEKYNDKHAQQSIAAHFLWCESPSETNETRANHATVLESRDETNIRHLHSETWDQLRFFHPENTPLEK